MLKIYSLLLAFVCLFHQGYLQTVEGALEPKFVPRCYLDKHFERYCGRAFKGRGVSLPTCLNRCDRIRDCFVANWFPEQDTCIYFLRTRKNHVCKRRVTKIANPDARMIRCYFDANTLSDCEQPLKVSETNCAKNQTLRSYQTFDGSCNNLARPTQGAAKTEAKRLLPAKYFDVNGLDTPFGHPSLPKKFQKPTPLQVMEKVFSVSRKDGDNVVSVMHLFFGQFYDHDVALLENSGQCNNQRQCTSINDFKYPCFPILKRAHKFSGCSPFTRSFPVCQKEGGKRQVRNQLNEPTAYPDLSTVYGTSEAQADDLRIKRDGKLKTSAHGNLLPADLNSPLSCNRRAGGCYDAGDQRVNENIGLASVHTLFMREHNRLASHLKKINPQWNDERLFQEARKIAIAEFQQILFSEYVPTLTRLSSYKGYKPNTNAQIDNAFQTAAFRFAHSQIPNFISLLDANFDPVADPLLLQQAFRNNSFISNYGIEPVLFGLVGNTSNTVDGMFANSVFKKLFIEIGKKMEMNLAAINIQRGRDHGVPSYQDFRQFCNLARGRRFADFIQIPYKDRLNLKKVYKSVYNHIDLFVGGIIERKSFLSLVGPTFQCIIRKHYEDVRDGDRFYYENPGVFTPVQLAAIKQVTMARLLCDNLQGAVSIQRQAFKKFNIHTNKRVSCANIPKINLRAWHTSY